MGDDSVLSDAAWELREAVIVQRVKVSTTGRLFEHLSYAPWGVEYLRGRTVTSLRDGSMAVIETVDNTGLAHVRWFDEQSSVNNSGSAETRTSGKGKKAKPVTVFVGVVVREDEEWVLADRAAVLVAFPDVAPLPQRLLKPQPLAAQADEFDAVEEYTTEEVETRAIPAKCPRCKRSFLGRDAIRAPSLDNVCCFYCGPRRTTRLVIHPKHKGFVTAKMAREMDKATLFSLPTQVAKTG